ncbi:chromate transporter [Terrihabitans sp. B22-R8]|uniref:chromate transporter n=1 Tax=Terrihabitans sp. B22-R8 TaxID=3425128 RepID=UPI00403D4964
MNEQGNLLAGLGLQFALLSLVAVGGVNSVLPEMHRQLVDANNWLTDAQFTQFFAIAQAAPGPNIMIVTLIGWHVAGLTGALVATLGMTLPTCALAYAVSGTWMRFRNARWRKAIQAGVIPVTIGLVCAGAYVISAAAATDWRLMMVTAVTALILIITRIHPLIPLAIAGTLGYLGFL